MSESLTRRLAAEFLGTAGLLAAIIGSGIMAETLSGGNDGVALIGCTAAIGAALVVLIWLFLPVSGCHINPAVTLALLLRRRIAPADAALYVPVQAAGALAGMLATHAMFDLPLLQIATTVRTGPGQWFSEFVATVGLLATIFGAARFRPQALAPAVGLYIFAACWFTASTSFANPAVTLARSFTDTFCGIRPADAPPFVLMQVLGATAAAPLSAWLWPDAPPAQPADAGTR